LITVLPFDGQAAGIVANIYLDLKTRSQLIPTDDILIAATAIRNNLQLATLNTKDFKRINGLEIIFPKP
jgi:predicted nucleic acid-binding protein